MQPLLLTRLLFHPTRRKCLMGSLLGCFKSERKRELEKILLRQIEFEIESHLSVSQSKTPLVDRDGVSPDGNTPKAPSPP
jgi:hypothetical protein